LADFCREAIMQRANEIIHEDETRTVHCRTNATPAAD
jgi:hypothetical protein